MAHTPVGTSMAAAGTNVFRNYAPEVKRRFIKPPYFTHLVSSGRY